jgi:hypothetical protein
VNIERLNIGMCANTYKINIDDLNFIIQIYTGSYKYHAYKKQYVFDLIRKHTEINVPNAYVGDIKNNSFLISEKCPGELLSDVINNITQKDRYKLFFCIGKQLAVIHSGVPTENRFGWIDSSGLKKNFNVFADYLDDEIKLIINPTLKDNLDNEKYNYMALKIEFIYNIIKHCDTSSLLWTDLNRNNIIVDIISNKYILYWLDPAAARFGPSEWDLANARIHLCVDESDYYSMIDGYKTKNNFNEKYIDSFIDFVKICDLVLAYKSKNLDLFYQPYKYWFNE